MLQDKSPTAEKETARVEAFSDGVFAIAVTLLILEIHVPHLEEGLGNRALWEALGQLWPSFLAYIGSFTAVLIMWVNHHGMFRLMHGSHPRFLFANGLLLLMVTFVPFPTALLAKYLVGPSSNAAAAVYCLTYIGINISYILLWRSATGCRLIKRGIPDVHIRKIKIAYLSALPIYVAAAAISFLNAYLGLVICSSLWILWARLDYTPQDIGPASLD